MGLFDARPTQGADFLAIIDGHIRRDEFDLLRAEDGFSAPNDFPIEAVIAPLGSRQFPREDPHEYEWAIDECDRNHFRLYSAWMRTYLAALYVYCNKRKQRLMEVESDYYYLVLERALAQEPQEKALVPAFLSFLEWLSDWVEADEGYNAYYCLLTWALLRRLSGTTDHNCFRKVMDLLLAKHYSEQELRLLTVAARGIEAWFALHERIPCPEALRTDFERIIRGS